MSTDSNVIPFGRYAAIERDLERRRHLALGLVEGIWTVWQIELAIFRETNPGADTICALCTGEMPPMGWAYLILAEDGRRRLFHKGCREQAREWVPTPGEDSEARD